MKRYLIITGSLLVMALLAVIVVYWLVATELSLPVEEPTISDQVFESV